MPINGAARTNEPQALPEVHYSDFIVTARRESVRSIAIQARGPGEERPSRRVVVTFPAREADEIRAWFRGTAGDTSGAMMMTQQRATTLGKRLAEVLLPPAVFSVLARSLGERVRRGDGGLRIRLDLDPSLVDLPWEYVYRPDRLDGDGLSGFLLLDPTVSLVRMAADPRMTIDRIAGREKLAFVGAMWDDGRDIWGVKEEFDRLESALEPVASYISPSFARGIAKKAFWTQPKRSPAIFHYAGHVDFEPDGRAYMVREVPSLDTSFVPKLHIDELGALVKGSAVRLCVMSACNSGFWPSVKPLMDAGVPAVIGANGIIASQGSIEFCSKLYESLAIGLSLDEAVGRARVHLMQWGVERKMFDWGLYMTYMPSPHAVIFPRTATNAVVKKQRAVRQQHRATVQQAVDAARSLDGSNFGEIMSELTKRRVLILGRFTKRRLKVLEAIKEQLARHPNGYVPELFTFAKPAGRDLVESIIGFAALSRFIIADLSEPKSVQSELEAIVPSFQSVPVVPLINQTGREYATFSSIRRRPNVVKPTVRYRDENDVRQKVERAVIPSAEAKLNEVRPDA